MKLRLIEEENLKEYSDNPEPAYEDTVRVPVTVEATFTYTIEVPKSSTKYDSSLEDYITDTIKDLFPDEWDNYEIEDINYNYISDESHEADLADTYNDDVKLGMYDSEEATQPNDIAKKEEYINIITPNFKVGKKIKEEK